MLAGFLNNGFQLCFIGLYALFVCLTGKIGYAQTGKSKDGCKTRKNIESRRNNGKLILRFVVKILQCIINAFFYLCFRLKFTFDGIQTLEQCLVEFFLSSPAAGIGIIFHADTILIRCVRGEPHTRQSINTRKLINDFSINAPIFLPLASGRTHEQVYANFYQEQKKKTKLFLCSTPFAACESTRRQH